MCSIWPISFPRPLPASSPPSTPDAADLTVVARYAEELVKSPKVKGFKFHPPDQGFYPNDKRFYDIWEIIQASGKPALFHVGFTVLGANTDGGSGIALDYGRPIHLDTLARDFPKMKIIAAHPRLAMGARAHRRGHAQEKSLRRHLRLSGRTASRKYFKRPSAAGSKTKRSSARTSLTWI